MVSNPLQSPVIKTSKSDVLEKASKAFAVLDTHSKKNCAHCIELLKEIFDNNMGHESRPVSPTRMK